MENCFFNGKTSEKRLFEAAKVNERAAFSALGFCQRQDILIEKGLWPPPLFLPSFFGKRPFSQTPSKPIQTRRKPGKESVTAEAQIRLKNQKAAHEPKIKTGFQTIPKFTRGWESGQNDGFSPSFFNGKGQSLHIFLFQAISKTFLSTIAKSILFYRFASGLSDSETFKRSMKKPKNRHGLPRLFNPNLRTKTLSRTRFGMPKTRLEKPFFWQG